MRSTLYRTRKFSYLNLMSYISINRRRPNFVAPAYSKSRVNLAGKAFSGGLQQAEDFAVLENWRTSHAYLLNTFQATLRYHARSFDAVVAQRLKRRPTIIGKLSRFPHMQVARMHDIAGCRVIFESLADLFEYRKKFIERVFSTNGRLLKMTDGTT